jgi:hypothetical protein
MRSPEDSDYATALITSQLFLLLGFLKMSVYCVSRVGTPFILRHP